MIFKQNPLNLILTEWINITHIRIHKSFVKYLQNAGGFIVHFVTSTCNSSRLQHTLQNKYNQYYWSRDKLLPGLPVKGLITAYIGRNPTLSNLHPHRICIFRTPSFGLNLNADDQYSQLKRFTLVRYLTDWANENHTSTMCIFVQTGFFCFVLFCFVLFFSQNRVPKAEQSTIWEKKEKHSITRNKA